LSIIETFNKILNNKRSKNNYERPLANAAKKQDVFVLVKSGSIKSFDSDDDFDSIQQENLPVNSTLTNNLNVNQEIANQETTQLDDDQEIIDQETNLPADQEITDQRIMPADQEITDQGIIPADQEITDQGITLPVVQQKAANNQSTKMSVPTTQLSADLQQQDLIAAISQLPNNIVPLILNFIQIVAALAAASSSATASTSLFNIQNATTISNQSSQANEVSLT
jgi:hypothetical protein